MDELWYIELIGSVIHQAICDYSNGKKGGKQIRIRYEDAENFLFSTTLDKFLKTYDVDDLVNAAYIRKFARKLKEWKRRHPYASEQVYRRGLESEWS